MATSKKTNRGEALRKKLFRKDLFAWDMMGAAERKTAFTFSEDYKAFLNEGKTEREAVKAIVKIANKSGFKIAGKAAKQSKYLWTYRGKNAAVAVKGTDNIKKNGVKIIVSHVDSPRLDLKQNPLYEDLGMGYLKTHYYGGIKKYQWLSRPLALHGTVVRKDGKSVDVTIGEDASDPVFTINDLLPHLAGKAQMTKKIGEAVTGEKLNILIGGIPYGTEDDGKDRVKLAVIQLLNDKYGIVEEDFVSAELAAVPADKARDVGLDRSFVGSYGHDDRICAFTSMRAVLDAKKPKGTTVALFLDKEEIGSEGNTGAQSRFLLDVIGDLLGGKASEKDIRTVLAKSQCLSADVNAGMDPDWQQVHEPRNAGKINQGLSLTKFTGVRGKAGASDANAEFVGKIRNLFNSSKVAWHAAELGKVDEGGGGTIAKFFAKYGMDVLDCGPPVLAMHSPYELASKADIYMTYKGYKAFVEKL